ncbi:MAG: YchJ family metal-binding protein [Campylobacterales bacterium]|nr:YchJ family metal-binding protein [Campylobacterales bacterium]
MMKCYCKSGNDFKKCCEPFLKKKRRAKTPEELMRSRYSAYCVKNSNYLVKTTYPKNRTESLKQDVENWGNSVEFYKLEVINSFENQVEFKAFYRQEKEECIHHEKSDFKEENGIWHYEKGQVL